MTPYREVRASYDDRMLVVYQAYRPAIADAALRAGTFAPPFSRDRMTWVKPCGSRATPLARAVATAPPDERAALLPVERPYPLPPEVARRVGAS